jgi:hypothetical protein
MRLGGEMQKGSRIRPEGFTLRLHFAGRDGATRRLQGVRNKMNR